ncbi:ABC transporter permease [Phycisphaera mikurensis]|uniref:Putative nitrate ABC transporter permease protein n=1 Tax=Phycisphaera mikurensis (strain NBRC 102666 / KCTC 22515 / FYK2301M01) TaxID=1142394 RepID=I0IG10_PHYMF|nr:ABC transporter permease subunit [Phycisphaera mikurensis]MBB6440416.1 nitrate/nitrite transport system permease protein [Phycisphaera mikurensis]BAM04198.1 putative nitrate ABC transporter permease protein [Phycisphaera mikurensis NBRC 102666]
MSAAKNLKFGLLKVIDVTALGFLEPVVRLCYGEEPGVQVRKIGQFVVVPLLAICAFFVIWAYVVSPNVKTKSGELPSPSVVWAASGSLAQSASWESDKEAAYLEVGPGREIGLAAMEAKLALMPEKIAAAEAALGEARAADAAGKDERIAPLQEELDAIKAQAKTEKKEREAALKEAAADLPAGESEERTRYLGEVAGLAARGDALKAEADLLEDRIKAIRDEKSGVVAAALAQQASTLEENQYLQKMRDQLGENSRETKIAEGEAKVAEAKAKFAAAEGPAAFLAAKRVVSAEERLAKVTESTYTKPKSIYYQVWRSIVCVFAGFFLGSLIAVPIGILCGLSKTFMAAMTPFIALFKPVSPIVWLPIALIVASAAIPSAESHWLTAWTYHVPILDTLEINPAFLASAATVALCSLWATMVNTALGVASVDKDHINVAKVLKLGFWSRLFKIVLPSALPLMFAGMRISLGVGWMVLIAAELLASSEGIGKFVWDQFNNGASDSFAKMIVVVFIVGIVGLLLDRIMVVFQRLVSFEGSVATV